MKGDKTHHNVTALGTATVLDKGDNHFDVSIENDAAEERRLAWHIPLPVDDRAARASVITGLLTAYNAGVIDGRDAGVKQLQSQLRHALGVATP